MNEIQLRLYQVSGITFIILSLVLLIWGLANTITNSFVPEKKKVMIARSILLGIHVILGLIAGSLDRSRTSIIISIIVVIILTLAFNVSAYLYKGN